MCKIFSRLPGWLKLFCFVHLEHQREGFPVSVGLCIFTSNNAPLLMGSSFVTVNSQASEELDALVEKAGSPLWLGLAEGTGGKVFY